MLEMPFQAKSSTRTAAVTLRITFWIFLTGELEADGGDQLFNHAEEEVHQQGQQAGGQGARDDLIVVHGADAGEDQVAQAAAADERGHGHQPHRGDGGDAHARHNHRQGLGNLHLVQDLEPGHADALGGLHHLGADAVDTGEGVLDDGQQGVEHHHHHGGDGADAQDGDGEAQQGHAGHGLNHVGHAQDGLAGFADVADQDAQGHADEDSHAYGDGGELDVFQEQGEDLCPAVYKVVD